MSSRCLEIELHAQLRDRAPRRCDVGCSHVAPLPTNVWLYDSTALVLKRLKRSRRDVRPPPTEAQDLRHAEVHLRDAIAVERARLDDVHECGLRVTGERAPERRLHLRVEDQPVRRQALRGDAREVRARRTAGSGRSPTPARRSSARVAGQTASTASATASDVAELLGRPNPKTVSDSGTCDTTSHSFGCLRRC